jgi:hypothetical protein
MNLRKLLIKEKNHKETKMEKERGRLRFLERQAETEEAEQQIKDYLNHEEEKDSYEGKPLIRPFS